MNAKALPDQIGRGVAAALAAPVVRDTVAPRREWSRRTSFRLAVAAQVVLFAGSNLPTPLFPIWGQRYDFGAGVVTLLFTTYIAAVVPVLLAGGPLAERVGRRPLLVAGTLATVVSSVAFATATGLAGLFAGEIVYGIGSGLVMACVAATIRELHPGDDVLAASRAATAAGAIGMTLGPLVGGLLAELHAWSTVAPFVLHGVVATILAAALTRIPETRPPTQDRTRTPRARVPTALRPAFRLAAAPGALSFMAIGWVFGLCPSFLHEQLGVDTAMPLVPGAFAALVMLANGAVQLSLRPADEERAKRLGLALLVVGMLSMTLADLLQSLALVGVGGLLIGVGSGLTQLLGGAAVQRIAPDHLRAAFVSAYFVLCYLALSVPVVVAGIASDRVGMSWVTALYGLLLAALAWRIDWSRRPRVTHVGHRARASRRR